jgi:hypothetical protein
MINIKVKGTVQKPISEVWKEASNEFTSVSNWATGVYKSRGGKDAEECDRVCNTSSGRITENILTQDDKDYILTYSVNGLPFFVKSFTNTWTLRKISNSETEITLNPKIKTMPVIGTIMEIPMKAQFQKFLKTALEDFAAYMETGKPSEGKMKEIAERK